jgi:hypothetical protein
MRTVPTLREQQRDPHPPWCQQRHARTTMHRSSNTVVRDRDGIKLDAYLVDYGDQPQLSLDITSEADATLIELSPSEASRLHAFLARSLGVEQLENQRPAVA